MRRREFLLYILIIAIILILAYDKRNGNYIKIKPPDEVIGTYSERRTDPEKRVNELIDKIGKGVKNLAKKKEQER